MTEAAIESEGLAASTDRLVNPTPGAPVGVTTDFVGRPLTRRVEVEKVFATALESILAKKQSRAKHKSPAAPQRRARSSTDEASPSPSRRRSSGASSRHREARRSSKTDGTRRRSSTPCGAPTDQPQTTKDTAPQKGCQPLIEDVLNETINLGSHTHNSLGVSLLAEVTSMRKDLMEMSHMATISQKDTSLQQAQQSLISNTVATKNDLMNICTGFAGRKSLDDLKKEVSCLQQRIVSAHMQMDDRDVHTEELADEANSLRKDLQGAIQAEREARIAESTEVLLVVEALREGLARTNAAVEAGTDPETILRILMAHAPLAGSMDCLEQRKEEMDKIAAMAERLEAITAEYQQQQSASLASVDIGAIAAKFEESIAAKVQEMTVDLEERVTRFTENARDALVNRLDSADARQSETSAQLLARIESIETRCNELPVEESFSLAMCTTDKGPLLTVTEAGHPEKLTGGHSAGELEGVRIRERAPMRTAGPEPLELDMVGMRERLELEHESLRERLEQEHGSLRERLEQERERRASENAAILTRMEELCRLNAESTAAMRGEQEAVLARVEHIGKQLEAQKLRQDARFRAVAIGAPLHGERVPRSGSVSPSAPGLSPFEHLVSAGGHVHSSGGSGALRWSMPSAGTSPLAPEPLSLDPGPGVGGPALEAAWLGGDGISHSCLTDDIGMLPR